MRGSIEPNAALTVRGLQKRFGGIAAVDGCDLDVCPAEIVGLVGPNGSGKSTIFNLITGVLRPDAGSVLYRGVDLLRHRPHEIARLGVARTFQEAKIFRELTLEENLAVAARGAGLAQWRESGLDLLARMEISHLADQPGDALSIGQQRLLEIAMRLLVDPPLMLLDEPLAGVHPVTRGRIAEIIRAQRDRGRSILLIEHDIRFVMDICDRVLVMDHGVKIAEGPPSLVRSDPKVVSALLGSSRRKGAG